MSSVYKPLVQTKLRYAILFHIILLGVQVLAQFNNLSYMADIKINILSFSFLFFYQYFVEICFGPFILSTFKNVGHS
jgi:hypothetical protein